MSNEAEAVLIFAIPSVVLAFATIVLALTTFRGRPEADRDVDSDPE
jgi:hypothetical protein